MKLEGLYNMSKEIIKIVGDKDNVDMVLYLNEAKHENLQQDIYKKYNQTLRGYESKPIFEVIISNIKFIIKYKG